MLEFQWNMLCFSLKGKAVDQHPGKSHAIRSALTEGLSYAHII